MYTFWMCAKINVRQYSMGKDIARIIAKLVFNSKGDTVWRGCAARIKEQVEFKQKPVAQRQSKRTKKKPRVNESIVC